MFRRVTASPDLVPQLSRGKHRNPRVGACFMEFASYLAGERWSDQPPCTHPLLAGLARMVNDHTTDRNRQRLVRLVPSVIGLTSDDPHVDVAIALRAATTALPVAAAFGLLFWREWPPALSLILPFVPWVMALIGSAICLMYQRSQTMALILCVLAALVYGGMVALVHLVNPKQGEMTVPVQIPAPPQNPSQ